MDPIKNTGAIDYAMTVPQNQNQVEGYEDYSSMPMVYDPAMEEKKTASSNMTGMAIAGIIGLAGIGTAIYKHKQVKGLKNQVDEITTKYEQSSKALDEANKEIEKLKPKKSEFKWYDPRTWFKSKKTEAPKTEAKPEGGEAPKKADGAEETKKD